MNNSLPSISELRNNLNFASISQFFHTFSSAFRPWPIQHYNEEQEQEEYVFETEDLERMILDSSEKGRLEDLLVRMLRLLTRNRFINSSTWQSYFAKEFDKREYDKQNPLYNIVADQEQELVDFFTLSLETKIHLIHLLCEWQLDDPERFREHLESEEGSVQWRVDPIGYDRKGATFWLFDDNRLYLETPKPAKQVQRKKKKLPFTSASRRSSRRTVNKKEEQVEEEQEEWIPWKLLCCSIQDWEQIPNKYANSDNTDEKKFHDLLVNDLLPKILPILEDKEKEIKKQEAMINRKRSSRILIRELEALERASSSESEFGIYESRTRSSNRLEQRNLDKERKEKENLAKAREERLLERERRLMEREYRAIAREQQREEEGEDENEIEDDEKKPTMEDRTTKTAATATPAKRKYKEKLDEYGNPVPKKKRGRKPKNRNVEDTDWLFNCICGVSGKNLDDGAPMIACEKCGTWQHIQCLQQFNQIDKNIRDLSNVLFVCQQCLAKEDEIDIEGEEEQEDKKKKLNTFISSSYQTMQPPSTTHNGLQSNTIFNTSFVPYQPKPSSDSNPLQTQSVQLDSNTISTAQPTIETRRAPTANDSQINPTPDAVQQLPMQSTVDMQPVKSEDVTS
ncbi:hypothetical protein G6F29_000856 [Rhizopus arrhizus]|nr:hypothetical protein G6F30_007574 [Rhizopus arrhizus]KAG1420304.1 hypothetical protein G6F58_004249 [Rhizopus delemar]KAG0989604.1 hypothetical protein G6F29_000856 [Rhizopus arrhizus]KAG0997779.1 hypothetical protein G6F28_002583 [Rhizopus arrhizus]KAG1015239.1 hypothetical protein G6F27_000240 [Rhizopus arrhizus]